MGETAVKRALIADDVALLRASLRDIVEAAGIEVVAEASDGEEAVRMALKHSPDVVFMDVVMPRKNGIEAAMEMRRLGLKCRVVICTSDDNASLADEAAAAGALALLSKPVDAAKLADAFKRIGAAAR